MTWLSFFGNDSLITIAEILVIVIGSMLLGILLSYFQWGVRMKEIEDLQNALTAQRQHADTTIAELEERIAEQLHVKEVLQNELREWRSKSQGQSKTIYDHHMLIASREAELVQLRESIQKLQLQLTEQLALTQRLEQQWIELQEKKSVEKQRPVLTVRASYDHVSQLLGKTVTENDLTIVHGIGPKTAQLLHQHGISTWEQLGQQPIQQLRDILEEAGGIYKSLDPSTWARQSRMAARSEWRKLRVYQQQMKEGG